MLNYRYVLLCPSEGSGRSRPSDKGGGGHPDTEIKGWGVGGDWSQKFFFSALQASVWSKYNGAGPPAPPLDPPLEREGGA